MKLDNHGYKLIADFEGLSLKPYLCPAKIPTIGYGNTYYPDGRRVTMADKKITEKEALEILKVVADKFAKNVSKHLKKELTQNQFNALVSFAYNVGLGNFTTSTLLAKVNKDPNDITIGKEFMRWTKAGGKTLKGLVKRRNYESSIYFTK